TSPLPISPRVAAFWPFAVFSPEWQALTWAARHQVPARFCDLPAAVMLATPPRAGQAPAGRDEGGAHGEPREDPLARLAAAAGYDDPERWWDDLVESRLDGGSPFAALTEAMAELRAATPEPPPDEQWQEERREAHMRQALRAALKQTDGPVAVICGAWHAPALAGTLPPAAGDAALLRGMRKRRVSLAWVPWTHSRLATTSGYGAGITSPGW